MNIEKETVYLIRHDAFYGYFLLDVERVFTEQVPTAGVGVQNDTVTLYINPGFWGRMSFIARVELLKHEVGHLIFDHLNRRGERHTARWNIAADLVLNQHLPTLCKEVPECCYPEKFNLPRGLTADEYYERLPEDAAHDGDSHDGWAKHNPQAVLNKAKKAAGRAPGNVPPEIRDAIAAMEKSLVNWRSVLRRFADDAITTSFEATRSRPNRRYGIARLGLRRERSTTLAVCVDTSGSMDSELLKQVFAEVDAIHKAGADITVIEADCSVGNTYKWTGKMPATISGGGGTDYSPALKAAQNLGVDGIIYIGDMHAPQPYRVRTPVLWVSIGGGDIPWGRGIKL